MATTEDVFPLFIREPNRNYYDCSKNPGSHCNNSWNGKCFCYHTECPIQPITIGITEVPSNINRKCYVKPNDECPICMETIINKSNAYLTRCGHSFHKKCIFKSMETRWANNSKNYCCPMCRTKLGLDIHQLNVRYQINDNTTCLDELENFWLNKEFYMPHMCRNQSNHYLGTDKNCESCNKYITTGDLFEL